jgi:hypothetical protein
MTRVRCLTLPAVIAVVCAVGLSAQDRPAWVQQAIDIGAGKDVRPYPLKRIGVQLASFTTPFLRVAIAATDAKKKLMKFDGSMVTDEMLQDVVIVRVPPIMGRDMSSPKEGVAHVVIKKPKSKNPEDALQPTTEEPFTESASNLMGAKIEKQGIIATFPLSALKEGQVFFIIYERGNGGEITITREMISQTLK